MNQLIDKKIAFTPLRKSDLSLLYQWFQEPLIKQWYARGKSFSQSDIEQKYLSHIQGKASIPSYIIYANTSAIRYIQYYAINDSLPEGITTLNHRIFETYSANELVGIDLLIAHDKNRGKGLGCIVIKRFINEFLVKSFKVVIVDPLKDNIRAIRCYEKTGFEKTNYSDDLQHLIMTKRLNHANSAKS